MCVLCVVCAFVKRAFIARKINKNHDEYKYFCFIVVGLIVLSVFVAVFGWICVHIWHLKRKKNKKTGKMKWIHFASTLNLTV